MINEEDEKKTENEQTAADNTEASQQNDDVKAEDAAQGNEEDGLDELLREFEEKKTTLKEEDKTFTESKDKTEQPLDVNALAELEKRIKDQEQREVQRDLNTLYKNLADGTQADEVDVEIYLGKLARDNPQLNQLYWGRADNPGAWKRAEKALRQEVAKRFGKKVDKNVTESRDAVASAVRSASTAAPKGELSAKDIIDASKDDWDEMQRKAGVIPV